MTDYRQIESQLKTHLKLNRHPVAIAYLDAPPPGVEPFTGSVPSSCSFWRLASEGRRFVTLPGDHYNCPIGAYTQTIALPADRAKELEDTLGFMASIGYIDMQEVPGIPRLAKAPGAIVYAPLGQTPVDPDVVLFIEQASTVMLLNEVAIRAGLSAQLKPLARPTCMALPATLATGSVTSTGCVGNRVYTSIEDGELYMALPGADVARMAEHAAVIASANATLLQYHTDRRSKLATV